MPGAILGNFEKSSFSHLWGCSSVGWQGCVHLPVTGPKMSHGSNGGRQASHYPQRDQLIISPAIFFGNFHGPLTHPNAFCHPCYFFSLFKFFEVVLIAIRDVSYINQPSVMTQTP